MKNSTIIVLLTAALAAMLQSCTTEPIPASGIPLSANDSLFRVEEAGFKFELSLPKDLMINNTPEIFYNEYLGVMEVRLGSGFNFYVSEEETQLASIKAEMAEDLFYKHVIVSEDESSFTCQRFLPDGQASYFLCARTFQLAGKNFLAKTMASGEFTSGQVEVMKKSMMSIH